MTVELSDRLVRLMRDASITPRVEHSMQLIVDEARDIVGASKAALSLTDKSGCFVTQACSPVGTSVPLPRAEGGLAQEMLLEGKTIRVDDTHNPQLSTRIREEVRRDARSLLGVPIVLGGETIGVLLGYGEQCNQFDVNDEANIAKLAQCAAGALGYWRAFTTPANEMVCATRAFLEFDDTATTVCTELKEQFGFDYVGLQLEFAEEHLLETIELVGSEKSWVGRSKHSLDAPTEKRDIQVDVFLRRSAEVIHGEDSRFDRWILTNYNHKDYSRAFIPMVIGRDSAGRLVPNLHEVLKLGSAEPFGTKNFRTKLTAPNNIRLETIGTVEAAFLKATDISQAQHEQLVRQVTRIAPRVWQGHLANVLEGVLDQALKLTWADSATLHFKRDNSDEDDDCYPKYVFESAARSELSQKLLNFPPRRGGLGHRAINDAEPKMITNPMVLKAEIPCIYELGVRAMAAFPLKVGEDVGVLYIHFRKAHEFQDNDVGWVTNLSRAAEAALHNATTHRSLRDQALKLEALRHMTSALSIAEASHRAVQQLALDTRNILGADVVTIYEFLAYGGCFLTPPARGGDLLDEDSRKVTGAIHADDVPMSVLRHAGPIFTTEPEKEPLLSSTRIAKGWPPFVERERIKAVSAVKLRAGDEIVGVMFVNFRRRHQFPKWERRFIEMLATSAAIAIHNQRRKENSEAMAYMGVLAGGIAHALVNDTGVAGRLISDLGAASPENSVVVDELKHSLDSITTRVDQLLLARYSTPASLNVLDVVIRACERAQQTVGIKVKLPKTAQPLPEVHIAQHQLTAIIEELIRNAARNSDMPADVSISMKLVEEFGRRSVELVVIDCGRGIPQADRESVFERGRTDGNGRRGFGLWWARTSLRGLGGDVRIEDNVPRGTRAVLRLPTVSVRPESPVLRKE